MPLYFFYTMVQKSQKWPKTQIKGGSCLKSGLPHSSTDLLLSRHKHSHNNNIYVQQQKIMNSLYGTQYT